MIPRNQCSIDRRRFSIDRFLVIFVLVLSGNESLLAEQILLKQIHQDYHLKYAEVPRDRYCKNPVAESHLEQHKDISVGRAASIPNKPSDFFASKVLRFSIDANLKVCRQPCLDALEHTILVAIGLWRSGCSRCRSNNFNVILIGDSVWVDSVTLDKWLFAIEQELMIPNRDPYAASRATLRPFGLQPIANFRRFNDLSLKRSICEKSTALEIDREVYRTICGKISVCNLPSCMHIPVRIGVDRASCMLNSKIIACGTPDSEVGINTDDFRFTYEEKGFDAEFGEGGRKVSLLYTMVHEFGHLFGLPHDNVQKAGYPVNIMSDGYRPNSAWCVTSWNLIQLDNAMDKGWSPRLIENTGLQYKE